MRQMLEGVFGNESLRRSLGDAVADGTLPHALLIEGGSGSGKFTLAKELAAALCCRERHEPSHPLPCRRCDLCRRVLEGNAVDVSVLDKAGKATIGVEPIRQLRSDMFLSPTEADGKVYIIRDAECLTVQAQNALLIGLEEPPPGVYLFLLTESADRMLTTVRSRARLLRMEKFSPEEIHEYLRRLPAAMEKQAAEPEAYRAILQGCHGHIGEALTLLDKKASEGLLKMRSHTDGLMACLAGNATYSRLCDALAPLPTARGELSEELELALTAVRDLAALRCDKEAPLCYYTDRQAGLALAEKLSEAILCRVSDELTAALFALDQNANVTVLTTRLKDRLRSIRAQS